MWQQILTALALVMIIEGMIPFISPKNFRRSVFRMAGLGDNILRFAGLATMVVGLALLYFIRS